MGWLVGAAALSILLVLPLRLFAKYDPSGAGVSVKIGPKSFILYPKSPAGRISKHEKGALNTGERSTSNPDDNNISSSFSDFMPLIRTILELLNDIRKKIRVDYLELRLILANDDPSVLGINYGKAWAVIGSIIPQLENVFQIKKRNVDVSCDFTSMQTIVFARADVSITLGRVLWLTVIYGIKALKQRFKLMNQRKGGAKV